MPPHESDLYRLAEAVADGSDVDWEQAESSASDLGERQAIQGLRQLAAIGVAARAQQQTWGPLQIRGAVGKGSFGTVFRAWDPRLEREVALKLIHVPDDHQPHSDLVIKEARMLARIRHPHVVAVHGVDVFDGRAGLWMEFVSGRTLREMVTQQGPFGAHEAAVIGRDLCRALAAVHQQGFLHLDIKAQNVMREAGGRTVLMDFGASRRAIPTDDEAALLRGTPAYVAPEVLAGEAPTARSDLYSLGVLLYFLVSGEFPVRAASLDGLRARHARAQRTPLRDVRPDLPSPFVRVVDSATALNPDDRPESAGAMEMLLEGALRARADDEDLASASAGAGRRPGSKGLRPRELLTGETAIVRPSTQSSVQSDGQTRAFARTRVPVLLLVLMLAIVTASVAVWWNWSNSIRSRNGETAAVRRASVAILPFRNLTASNQDDYFGEGIMADLVANLTSLRDLRVIAGASMARYAPRDKTPIEIGRELGVATVLDTSIRRSETHVRIVSQLVDARSGEQIWSESFDSALADIVSLKSDVAHKIAVALKGELSERDMQSLNPGRRPYDFEAFNLYLKGRHYGNLRTEEAVNRSIQYFHDALNRDPGFALAYAGLANAYTQLGVYGAIPREEAYARAAAAAEKAVQLDDTLAEAHASLGLTQKNRFEWRAAEASFKRAIEIKPGYSTAHHWYSIYLTQHGRFAEAITEAKIALSLDPLSIGPNLQFAAVLMMARRYDDAIAQFERTARIDARFAAVHRHIGMAYAHRGLPARALEELDAAARESAPGAEDQELKADRAYVHARLGQTREAEAIAAGLIERYERTGERVAGSIAAIRAGLGQKDAAMEWLARATNARDPEVGYLKVDPKWDPLRGDPRFDALLQQLGLTP